MSIRREQHIHLKLKRFSWYYFLTSINTQLQSFSSFIQDILDLSVKYRKLRQLSPSTAESKYSRVFLSYLPENMVLRVRHIGLLILLNFFVEDFLLSNSNFSIKSLLRAESTNFCCP